MDQQVLEFEAQMQHEYNHAMLRIVGKILYHERLTESEQIMFMEYMDDRL